MKFLTSLLCLLLSLQLGGCSNSADPEPNVAGPTGKLLYTSGLKVYEYDIASKSSTFLSNGEGAIRLADQTLLMMLAGDLVIKSADGSQLVRTVIEKGSVENSEHDEGLYQHLRISPDGDQLAYHNPNSGEGYVIALATSALVAKTAFGRTFKTLNWLDNNTLILEEVEGFSILKTFNVSTKQSLNYEPIILGASTPELSFDKQRLIALRTDNVVLVEGSEVTQITNSATPKQQAIFSPDDKWIAILTENGTIEFYDREKDVTITHEMTEHSLALQPGIFWQ
jgi:hypothetical protein